MPHYAGYDLQPFSVHRRAVAASAAVGRERDTIQLLTEVDITEARRRMRALRERTGESLSLTAYVVASLARAVAEFPQVNSLRTGRHLAVLHDVTINVLFERTIGTETVPEPRGIISASQKSLLEIHEELRAAQRQADQQFGSLSGAAWLMKLVPAFLYKALMRWGSRSISMARRYGVIAVTAVGMFGPSPLWAIPLSGGTLAVAVGSIVERPRLSEGQVQARECLCITLAFDHDIIDGAPAARFAKRFSELLTSCEALTELEG
jgi:pyruvate/2-oxoglutarate dehydrogenase complex dihydrolipoamide acyltransferase (E2) component